MKKKDQAAGADAPPKPPSEELIAFYSLLRETEPTPDPYDVIWRGPYWIDKAGQWHPTTFVVRRGVLTGNIELRAGAPIMEGNIRTGDVTWIDIDRPGWPKGSAYWPEALPEVHRTLRAALQDLDAYHRRIEQEIPLESRTGKIVRRMTWGEDEKPLPGAVIAAARAAIASAKARPPLPALSADAYQRIAEIGIDAAYPREKLLPRAEKLRMHADKRHGGMLDLPPEDAAAFREWFTSRRWEGAHPFEIAYGIPHGIVLWPILKDDGWRFVLSSQDEIYQKDVVQMAIAMDQAGVPFDFSPGERLLQALEGTDDVSVGPHRGQLSLQQLREDRPDAIEHIRWDPLERLLAPVTPAGRAKIAWVEEHGTLAGYKDEAAGSS